MTALDRRGFLGAAVTTLAGTRLGMLHSEDRTQGFGPLKQIDAGLLNVGYVDAGPVQGPAVVLLHGWPYDIHAFGDVVPLLTAKGHRVIVPHLRGHGTTRFPFR